MHVHQHQILQCQEQLNAMRHLLELSVCSLGNQPLRKMMLAPSYASPIWSVFRLEREEMEINGSMFILLPVRYSSSSLAPTV
uniref:Uncharacterized protein n=1 Tax=Oryza brachyantha TaxID=4533 RepID=J3MQG4_ORYBR